jgi:hypothetical protein
VQGQGEKTKSKTEQEELLEEAFHACMEEQLSFIPPESEIARMHTFSESFTEAMRTLLRTRGKPEKRQISKAEFIYSFNKIAACILGVLVVGGVCAGGFLLLSRDHAKSSYQESAEAPAEEAASDMAAASAEEPQESAEGVINQQEETGEATEEGLQQDGGSGALVDVEFMGQKIHPASYQKLPEKAGNIKTLVNSPLIARDAESIKVTIGNMEEYQIYYYANMDLEVLIDGAWYLIPSKQDLSEEESDRMVMLEPGMAQDEEIFLENYDLDFDAEKYRVVTYLDGWILSSEFRFENPETDLEEALENVED